MKVCISAAAAGLDSQIDPRFGRCPYFVFVDADTMQSESIENANIAASGGAGIQSAQFVANEGVAAVLTGNVGPNAYKTLQAAGVHIITGVSGTVKEAVEAYKNGRLASDTGSSGQATGRSMGTGRGMGRGKGTGRGMGMGRGMGRGMDMGTPPPRPVSPGSSSQPPASKEEELRMLKEQSETLRNQLDAISQRIEQLEKG